MEHKYYPEIDGLRAIAVLAVLIGHTGLRQVPGGFIGVDIFFVISGFLISGLIISRIEKEQFSFWNFFARRLRRIAPALLVFLTVNILIASVVFVGEYRDINLKMAAATALSFSNLFIAFGGVPVEMAGRLPLFHTWSLGVEEQFYILLPPFLYFVGKSRSLDFNRAVFAATFLAFFLAVSLAKFWMARDTQYYLLEFRAWELLLGASIERARHIRKPKDKFSSFWGCVGIILILIAALTAKTDSQIPEIWRLLPTIGASPATLFQRDTVNNQ